jgi:hypothetical protein
MYFARIDTLDSEIRDLLASRPRTVANIQAWCRLLDAEAEILDQDYTIVGHVGRRGDVT